MMKNMESVPRVSHRPAQVTEQNPVLQKKPMPMTLKRIDDESFHCILELLNCQYSVDFSHYKRTTLTRQILKHFDRLKMTDMKEYLSLLNTNQLHLRSLFKSLLVCVTSFFRDAQAFATFEDSALPNLVKQLNAGETLRVWCPGCASGEEAFSIAMVIESYIVQHSLNLRYKIFATDLNEDILKNSYDAVYTEEEVAHVPEKYKNAYFHGRGQVYLLAQKIRKHVVFARQDLLEDSPFTRIHLISCRNLLIYLNKESQSKVLNLFTYSLKPNGVLFLGPSETPVSQEENYTHLSQRFRIYKKIGTHNHDHHLQTQLTPTGARPSQSRPPVAPKVRRRVESRQQHLLDAVLKEFMPPSILVNQRFEVLQVFGGAGKYLEPQVGVTSLHLENLLPPNVSTAIQFTIPKVGNNCTHTLNDISFTNNALSSQVNIKIKKTSDIKNLTTKENFFMIIIEEREQNRIEDLPTNLAPITNMSSEKYNLLEEQLISVKKDLQITISELEATNEELINTNEELIFSNDQFQSTNEELQSVNEELFSVNYEFQNKIEELIQLKEDEENLLKSIDIGAVFLDSQLCIRRFTQPVMRAFNLLKQDVGRPLEHLSHNLKVGNLIELIHEVKSSKIPIEKEVLDKQNNWFLLRILPYELSNGQVDGIVLTFVNINGVKEMEKVHSTTFKEAPYGLIIVDENLKIETANKAAFKLLDTYKHKILGSDLQLYVMPKDRDLIVQSLKKLHNTKDPLNDVSGISVNLISSHSKTIPAEIVLTKIPSLKKNSTLVSVIDKTEQRNFESKLLLTKAKLEESNKSLEQFAYAISHDLQAPIRHISQFTQILQQSLQNEINGKNSNILDMILKSTEKVKNMIAGLLDISLLEKKGINREDFDSNKLVHDCLSIYRNQINSKGAHIIVKDLPKVNADKSLCMQVFMNLIGNALKFAPESRKPCIVIEAEKIGERWVFKISDNGVGIDLKENVRDKIFNIFQRASNAKQYPGTGIGLSTCSKIIKIHGGHISVDSELGKGSQFTFSFESSTVLTRNHA